MRKLTDIIREVLENKEFIAYHGSDTEIDKFSDEFVGKPDAPAQEGSGIYFTTNAKNARMFGKNVYKVRLKGRFLSRQLPASNINRDDVIKLYKMTPEWEMDAQNWSEDPETGVEMAVDSIIDQSKDEAEVFQYIEGDLYKGIPKEFVRNMVKIGYDGLVTWAPRDFHGDKHIILYNPAIIEYLGRA